MFSATGNDEAELHSAGEDLTAVAPGAIACIECGYALPLAALAEADAVPACPACGSTEFRRTPMFEQQPTEAIGPVEHADHPPSGMDAARAKLEAGTYAIAWEEDGEIEVRPLPLGWTRVGRSGAADLRLDDPTVSRRHALVVLTEQGELRALDDRSLNGLFVNGKRVEWAPLDDGDELEVGRYRLFILHG
jgi:hypothetical protein